MGTTKDKLKAAVGFDYMADILQKAVQRWTAKSPKTYRVITDVAIGAGIAATIVTMIPATYPIWVLPTTAILIALGAKFTVEK